MSALKNGDVVKFKKLVLGSRYVTEGEHWGVIIDDQARLFPDGVIYTRTTNDEWTSQVASIGGGDEFELASEDDVPEDIPDDFWALAARYKLLGGGDA